jgi:hypothetical protein
VGAAFTLRRQHAGGSNANASRSKRRHGCVTRYASPRQRRYERWISRQGPCKPLSWPRHGVRTKASKRTRLSKVRRHRVMTVASSPSVTIKKSARSEMSNNQPVRRAPIIYTRHTAACRTIVTSRRTQTAPKLTPEAPNVREISARVLRQLAAGVPATDLNARSTLPLFVLQSHKQLRSCVRVQRCDYRSASSCKQDQ